MKHLKIVASILLLFSISPATSQSNSEVSTLSITVNKTKSFINALDIKFAPFASLEFQEDIIFDTNRVNKTSVEIGVAALFSESYSSYRSGFILFSKSVEWNYVGPYLSVGYNDISFTDSITGSKLDIKDYYSSRFTLNGGIIAGHGDSGRLLPGLTANLGVKYDFDNLYLRAGIGLEVASVLSVGINTYLNTTRNNSYDRKFQKFSINLRLMLWSVDN